MTSKLSNLSERCHACATRRGKDTSWDGCLTSIEEEQREYWNAQIYGIWGTRGRDIDDRIKKAESLTDDESFTEFYDVHLHNTAIDELADLLITAATMTHTAKLYGVKFMEINKTIFGILLYGVLEFVHSRLAESHDDKYIDRIVRLKMRYNELRKD